MAVVFIDLAAVRAVICGGIAGEKTMKTLYLLLAALGFCGSYVILGSFVAAHGLDLDLLTRQVTATPGAALATFDLLVCAVVVWLWMFHEAQTRGIARPWLYVILSFVGGGLCFALPLFLYVRAGTSPQASTAFAREVGR